MTTNCHMTSNAWIVKQKCRCWLPYDSNVDLLNTRLPGQQCYDRTQRGKRGSHPAMNLIIGGSSVLICVRYVSHYTKEPRSSENEVPIIVLVHIGQQSST